MITKKLFESAAAVLSEAKKIDLGPKTTTRELRKLLFDYDGKNNKSVEKLRKALFNVDDQDAPASVKDIATAKALLSEEDSSTEAFVVTGTLIENDEAFTKTFGSVKELDEWMDSAESDHVKDEKIEEAEVCTENYMTPKSWIPVREKADYLFKTLQRGSRLNRFLNTEKDENYDSVFAAMSKKMSELLNIMDDLEKNISEVCVPLDVNSVVEDFLTEAKKMNYKEAVQAASKVLKTNNQFKETIAAGIAQGIAYMVGKDSSEVYKAIQDAADAD